MKILLLNGPNLGRLGKRKPEIYGTTTLAEVVNECRDRAEAAGWELDAHQSNLEGMVIDRIEDRNYDAIIINPGAWSHYSYALRDALEGSDVPVAEVHISDINAREPFRQTDVIAEIAAFTVVGKGVAGYGECVDWVVANVGPRVAE